MAPHLARYQPRHLTSWKTHRLEDAFEGTLAYTCVGDLTCGGLPMYALSPIDALLAGLLLAIIAFTVIWIYRDASILGMSGGAWCLLALFTWPIGVYVYLLLRNSPWTTRMAISEGPDIGGSRRRGSGGIVH